MDSEDEVIEQLDADVELESDGESTQAEDDDEVLDGETPIPDEITAEEAIIIVPPEQWQTPDILSRFEMTRLISLRAAEIEATASSMIKIDTDDPIKLAKAELAARKCPLIVRRQVGRKIIKIGNREVMAIFVECRDPNVMAHGEVY